MISTVIAGKQSEAWYDKFFPGRLVTTQELGTLSKEAEEFIEKHFS